MTRALFALVCTIGVLLAFLFAGSAAAQTTTFNGIVKDLTLTPVSTGQVSFQLRPGIDTTIGGNARFTSTTVFCEIHNPSVVSTSGTGTITVVVGTAQNWQVGDSILFAGTADATLNANTVAAPYTITLVNSTTSFNFTQSGTHTNGAGGTVGGLYKSGGTGGCAVTQNTAITPANTSYNVGLWPLFSLTSSFNTYAIGSGPVDISTIVPTPGQQPAYSFVDAFTNQSISAMKTLSGNGAGLTGASGASFLGTWAGNPTLSGNPNFSGNPTFSGAPAITVSNAGVFTNTQMNLNVSSVIAGINITTQYQGLHSGNNGAEALTGGIDIGNSVGLGQVDAIGGFVTNHSGTVNGVAGYLYAQCFVAASKCWGSNIIARDTTGLGNGVTLYGIEVDVSPFGTSYANGGMFGVIANINTGAAPSLTTGTAFYAYSGDGIKQWQTGYQTQSGGVAQALNLGAICTTGTCSGQQFVLNSFSSSALVQSTFQTDSSGNFTFQAPAGAGQRWNGSTSGFVQHLVPATVTSYAETDPSAAPTVANSIKQYTTGGVASFSTSPGTLTIASGTATMTTAAIASQACGTVVTVAATNTLTTDAITAEDNAQPAAATNGVLIIKSWPTANNVNFFYCNPTAASVTPAAATLNWRVMR